MSWKNIELGNLCDVLDSKRKPITKRNRTEGAFPYYGATGIVDYVGDYIFDEKLVLIGEDGAKWESGEKTAFIADGKYWVNNHAHVIKPNRELLIDEWLVYYFLYKDLKEYVTGLTVPKLNQGQLRRIPIPLPSVSTQKKIVTKLDIIFSYIEKATKAAEANIKNVDSLFYSFLNKTLNESKEGWKSVVLKDACTFVNRGISPAYIENDGILILNQKCVRNHTVNFELGRRHDDSKKSVKNERLVRYGDVLVNSTGTGTLGRVAQIVYEVNEKITVDSHVTIVRPNLNYFFANFFGFMMIQIEDEIKRAGEGSVGQTELSRTTLSEKFKLIFPADKKLQESLFFELTSAKENSIKVKYLMNKKIEELQLLKQSLLQKAFSGELVKE